MAKLIKLPNGRYQFEYKGRDCTVRKDANEHRVWQWIAESGDFECKSETRDRAIERLQREIDAHDLHVPEIDQLAARWAQEIQGFSSRLNPTDRTQFLLRRPSGRIEQAVTLLKDQAAEIEKSIRELRDEHAAPAV
jgi:hypothetical protein